MAPDLPLLPFTAIGVLTGLYLFKTVDSVMLAHGLGVFVLLYAMYTLFVNEGSTRVSGLWAIAGRRPGRPGRHPVRHWRTLLCGLSQHRGLPKTQFRATFATVFLMDGAGRLTGYFSGGFFDRDWLVLAAFSLPVMAIGLYAGGMFTPITQRTFQVAVSLLLVVSGISCCCVTELPRRPSWTRIPRLKPGGGRALNPTVRRHPWRWPDPAAARRVPVLECPPLITTALFRHLMIAVLIVLLHVPLVYQALTCMPG